MAKVAVRDKDENYVAEVEYNNNLDVWNGNNYTNGGPGRHLGITKLKSGSYVLIHGTQWQGESDTAEIVSDRVALNAIMQSDNLKMLDDPKYARLKRLLVDGEDDGKESMTDIVTEATTRKQGNSLVLILTDELRKIGADVGDKVTVVIVRK